VGGGGGLGVGWVGKKKKNKKLCGEARGRGSETWEVTGGGTGGGDGDDRWRSATPAQVDLKIFDMHLLRDLHLWELFALCLVGVRRRHAS